MNSKPSSNILRQEINAFSGEVSDVFICDKVKPPFVSEGRLNVSFFPCSSPNFTRPLLQRRKVSPPAVNIRLCFTLRHMIHLRECCRRLSIRHSEVDVLAFYVLFLRVVLSVERGRPLL